MFIHVYMCTFINVYDYDVYIGLNTFVYTCYIYIHIYIYMYIYIYILLHTSLNPVEIWTCSLGTWGQRLGGNDGNRLAPRSN